MENQNINNTFNKLSQNGMTIVEYVWIGGSGNDLRSKCKTVKGEVTNVNQLGEWNYDGSSTGQAPTQNSELLMRPVVLFNDPFRGVPNKICLCDTYHVDGTPTNTNFRHFAKRIFDLGVDVHEPHFGVEQEYFMMKTAGNGNALAWPLGWPVGGYPKAQFQYYCGTGTSNTSGRDLMSAHYKACLNAGVQICGTNAEVAPGQWEFQIGISRGIDLGDHLWMARYLLERCGEYYGVDIDYTAKPIKGDWNGSGCHCNFSNKATMAEGGMTAVLEQVNLLEANHKTSISLYGKSNHERLTGYHETSSMEKFSFGVANRGASVRIPRTTEKDNKGYYEDRRPAGDIDPYIVSSSMFSITCLANKGLDDLVAHYSK
jgi:glutamine synthetase